jgi:hypothetical protein
MTLKEFEMVSDTTEAQNPMNANRSSHQNIRCLEGSLIKSDNRLY